MKHLGNDQLLALAEHGSEHHTHLESCDTCRARVAELRETLAFARQVDVPEPSPLFWTHFSARVSEAIAEEPEPVALGWRARFGWLWPAGAITACAVVLLAVFISRTAVPPASNDVASRVETPATQQAAALAEGAAPDDDASWSLMTELTADLDLDTASEAGLVIRPGAAERAVVQLSDDERRVVADLLREELARAEL